MLLTTIIYWLESLDNVKVWVYNLTSHQAM